MTNAEKPQTIGIVMTTALVVGSIIGSGIFMLPASLAPLGWNSLIGWVVSGIGVLCIAYSMGRLSHLGGNGIQANIETEFGPLAGFTVAWSFWVANWASNAAIAVAAASALSFVGVQFSGSNGISIMAITWLIALTAINALGVRAAGGFSVITVAIKVLPLLAVIWLLAEHGATGTRYEPMAPLPVNIPNIAAATALTFFAFTGFESATTPVGKIRDPARTIARALTGGTAFVVVLYLLAGTAIQLLLPADVVASSPAPFADALVAHWGGGAAKFAALTIAVAAIGCLNGLILATGELGYAMALRGDLPSVMARTRGVNTPVAAQVVCCALSVLLLLLNSSKATASLYTFIILLSTAAMVVVYLASALAAWQYSTKPRQRIAIGVAFFFIVFAIYGLGLEADLWALVLLAAGLAIRWAMHRLNARAGSTPAVAG